MKQKLLHKQKILLLAITALFSTAVLQAAVIPYLQVSQNFGGSAADLSTFSPVERDYTLEVQGTIGVEISVAGGLYTYTPTTNGTVRFANSKGKVHVFEGNVYMTTLSPTINIAYPTITDGDAATNVANLLQNPSFETAGSLVGGTNYNFGTPWVSNVVVGASGGIRITNSTAGNVNGTWECIWRGIGNNNYFAQPVSAGIKPNTSYQVIIRQIAGANATANFNFGLGSTVNGLEYAYKPVSLGNGRNGTWNTSFQTPSNVSGTTYFTVRNTATGSGDPLTQMDYLALVEGSVTVAATGITGVSSASFLAGTAYAPESVPVNYSGGDSYDYTSFITNPSFESLSFTSTLAGWTNTNTMARQSNTPGNNWTKDGTYYAEKWIASGSNLPAASLAQTVTGLPNGRYRMTLSGHAIQQSNASLVTTGAVAFANTAGTPVNAGGNYTVENIVVADGTMSLGFKTEGTITCNWVGYDNFKIYYLGPITDPVLSAPQTALSLTTTTNTAAINLTGSNIAADVTITVPSTNITLSGGNVTGTSPNYTIATANANQLNEITVTWDKGANVTGDISFTSGSASKTVSIITSDVESVVLSGISISAGSLSPAFAVGTTTYAVKAPADVASVTVTASTNPSVATVNNNGTAISGSSTSVVLKGTSYNGLVHTADYTVNWDGNYTLPDWDANGSIDATLSVPTVYGWSASPSITWIQANGTTPGTVRYMDIVDGAGVSGATYSNGGVNYNGRIMFVRWDGSASRVYAYPVLLEACKSYNFTCKAAWNSVASAGNLTFGINSAKDNTGTNYASGVITTSTAGNLIDGGINGITVSTSGVYYLTITSSVANLCAIADLNMTEVVDQSLTLSQSAFVFDELNNTATFNVTGNALSSNVSLTAPTGVTLDVTSITPSQAQCGVTVTATYDNATAITAQNITATSGSFTQDIVVNASSNTACFTKLYPAGTNLITDSYMNSLTSYSGWGARSLSTVYRYCGAKTAFVSGKCGGSLDFNLTPVIAGSKSYRVKAMVSTNGTGESKIGISGAQSGLITNTFSTAADAWTTVDFAFTTQTTIASANMYMNSCETQTATQSYIDNLEMYEIPTPVITVTEGTIGAFAAFRNGTDSKTIHVSGADIVYNIGLQITGANADMFSVSQTTLTPASGSVPVTEITVNYMPTVSAPDHTATLTISSSAATSQQFALSGATTTTGVNGELNSFIVKSQAGKISVAGTDRFTVYNVQGLKIAEVVSNNADAYVQVNAGMYVVKANGQVQKVLVK